MIQLLDGYLNFYRKIMVLKKQQADIDAEAMVFGVKRVREGDYAILEGREW